MEEVNLMDAQIVNMSSDIFNSNRIILTADGSAIIGGDGMSIGDMGLSFVSIPVHIVQDTPVQQQVLTSELVPETTTIYIDQNQLSYLNNGQLVISSDGLLTSITEQPSVDKNNIFFSPTVTTLSEPMKPIRLNTMDLLATEDLLLEEPRTLDLEQRLPSVIDQPPPSPCGEELVITGGEASWQDKNMGNTERAAPKDPNKDIPPQLRKGPFKCDICFKEFMQHSQFRKHSQFHLEDKPYKCPLCSASFNIQMNLILHKATHQVDNPECPECRKKFSRVASLKAHIMLHELEESLFCTECGDEFGNQVQLDKHMKSHDEEWVKPPARVYQCPNCDKQYSKASVLRQHMKDHFKVKAALSANSYNRAIRRGRLLHSCSVCSKTFQKPSQLIRHNRIHTGERPFKCDMCSKSFNQKGSLLIHMMSKHKGMRPYQCQFCNAAFSQKGNLRAHVVRLHSIPNTQETVYQCTECSCVFRKLGSLNAHHNRMHPNSNISVEKKVNDLNQVKIKSQPSPSIGTKDASDKENDAEDNQDTSNFPQQRIITITNKLEDGTVKHTTMKQRLIGSIKWHQCTFCGKEFKKPSDLVRHTRIHTREKPYKCKFCHRGFTVRSTLVTHMRTHTGQKEFKCSPCNKTYSSASILKHHKRTQHSAKEESTASEVKVEEKDIQEEDGSATEQTPIVIPVEYQQPLVITDQGVMRVVTLNQVVADTSDRPHRCALCGQAYRKSNHLKVHMRNHSGERPFACTLCSRSFTSAGVLKSHMRTHNMLKTHRCNECGKYLSTKGSLRRHTETHAMTCPFLCPHCPRTYKSHSACRKHIKSHKIFITQENGENQQEQTEQTAETEQDSEYGGQPEQYQNEEQNSLSIHTSATIPNIEALLINKANVNLPPNTIITSEEPFIISSVEGASEITQTLHADATGTITLPNLTGQDTLTQENIREIEESLNQQLFCTADLNLDKEQVVLFDQGFESCVFPSITLQGEQLELGQALTSANLANVIPCDDKNTKLFSGEECGVQLKTEAGLNNPRLSHIQNNIEVEPRTITLGDATIQLEADLETELHKIEPSHETEYRCDECNIVLDSAEEMGKHRESHNSCDICEKTFATTAQYKAHIRSHGREKEFVCEHCGSSFTQLYSLARHMAVHNSTGRTYVCGVCFHSYRTEAALRRHTAAEHRETRRRRGQVRQITDEEAKHVVSQEATSMSERVLQASLAERDRISDVKDPEMFKNEPQHANQCKYCPKSFRKPSDLVRHLRIHTGERPYQCDFCSKCFTVKSTLDSHLKTHNSQKPCVCHVCGYYFATKGSLKVHMRLHTGSRPFRCPICFQRFRTSGHRKAHLLLHIRDAQPHLVSSMSEQTDVHIDNHQASIMENDKPPHELTSMPETTHYQCSTCDKIFNKHSYLIRHMRVHTGEKPFQCKECGKSFTQKNSLDTHSRIHKGEKLWGCSECDSKFTQKCNLEAHLKRHHVQQKSALLATYTIDLSDQDKFPVDLEKVVSDLFPHMKPTKGTIGADEL